MDDLTKLLIIRHGQSMANLEDIFAGHYDAELSELGHRQAEKTAEFIADNYDVDSIYASDLSRAYNTAKHLSDKIGIPIVKESEIREIQCGEWDGKKFSDLAIEYYESYHTWIYDIGKASCPGGESVVELSKRIMSAVDKIISENNGKTVVIATHATPIRVMQTVWQGLDIGDMKDVPWVSNASVTVVNCHNGNITFEKIGYDLHLGDIVTELPNNV